MKKDSIPWGGSIEVRRTRLTRQPLSRHGELGSMRDAEEAGRSMAGSSEEGRRGFGQQGSRGGNATQRNGGGGHEQEARSRYNLQRRRRGSSSSSSSASSSSSSSSSSRKFFLCFFFPSLILPWGSHPSLAVFFSLPFSSSRLIRSKISVSLSLALFCMFLYAFSCLVHNTCIKLVFFIYLSCGICLYVYLDLYFILVPLFYL